jgi:hypothetical protein
VDYTQTQLLVNTTGMWASICNLNLESMEHCIQYLCWMLSSTPRLDIQYASAR